MRDPHAYLAVKRTIAPQTAGTTGTGRTGKAVNRGGYQGVEVLFNFGSITATNATMTTKVLEGDTTGAMTTAAASVLDGAAPTIGATSSRVSDATKNVTKRVGYLGTKLFVAGVIIPTVSAGVNVSADVVLANPNSVPTANPA